MNLSASHGTRRTLFISVTLVIFAACLWLGANCLDGGAQAYISEALSSSAIIYGIARGINALVSVLQSTEVSLMLVSIEIGEILDPLNDLIERFSNVVVVAMFALVLQQIMLGIVSHDLFGLLLGLLALGCLSAHVFGRHEWRASLLRVLLIAIYLRLALGIAVMASGLVDRWFLQEPMVQQQATLEQLRGRLSDTNDQVSGQSDAGADRGALTERLDRLALERDGLSAELDGISTRLAQGEAHISARVGELPLWKHYFRGLWPRSTREADLALEPTRTRERELIGQLEKIDEQIETLTRKQECQRAQAEGKQCGWSSWLPWATSDADARQSLLALADDLDEYAASIIQLMVGLMMKSLLLPLLFLYGSYRVVRWLAAMPL